MNVKCPVNLFRYSFLIWILRIIIITADEKNSNKTVELAARPKKSMRV